MNLDLWLFQFFPIPEGMVILSEASYHFEFHGNMYARRNLRIDLSKCSDKHMSEINFSSDGIDPSTLVRLFKSYYRNVFCGVFGEIWGSNISGRSGENVIIYYGDGFTGTLRLSAHAEQPNCWYLDVALVQNEKNKMNLDIQK